MSLAVGTRIGPYEIVGWIGAGGMGEVYRARDPRLGRDVAIKLLPDTFAADRSRLHRFEQEARAVGQLNHPNILAIFDVGTHDGAPYLVSELLEGESLRGRLQRGALSARKAVDYARQIADGLSAAHDKGIVHRDLKPDNLFVTTGDRIKILDFGIAKLVRPADEGGGSTGLPTETEAGMVVGTQGYMSPEQLRGQPVDPRSDLFAFGAILYEMLAGRPAFLRSTAPETMAAILKEDPPPPGWTSVPPALERIVARCLEKSREARFQSARDLAFGLEVLSGTGPVATTVQRSPRWWLVAGSAVIVVGLIVAVAVWLMRASAPSIDERLAGATYTAITTSENTEKDAALSPDGRFIAFVSDQDGPFHVWLTQIGTGSFRDLTPGADDQRNPGVNRAVGFSADGSEVWIAGKSSPKQPEPVPLMIRLRLVSLMGGAPRPFLSERAINVTWSHDGHQLAYFTNEPGDPISVADATGGNARVIYVGRQDEDNREHNHFLAWSPDDRWIYYSHGNQATHAFDVWRVSPSERKPERLTHTDSDVQYITPIDARWVLYVAPAQDRSGPWLWALDLHGNLIHRVSTGLEQYSSIAASADGRRLAATVASSTAALWSVPILERPAEEQDVKPYSSTTSRAWMPRFDHAGSMFYLSSTGGPDGLWRLKDSKPSEIWKNTDAALSQPPAISRDGTRVAMVLSKASSQRLSIMSAEGTDARELAPSIDVQGTIDWSRDGKSIVTGGSDAQGAGLFNISVETGVAVRLVNGPAFDPVWSPAEDLIVYTGQQTAYAPLRAVRPDRTTVSLPDIGVPFAGGVRGRARFLPNGKGLVYLKGSVGALDFWLLDLATKQIRPLTHLTNSAATYAFDVSPDGREIVFDRVRERADIRLIDLK